jgi:hypothetical protein
LAKKRKDLGRMEEKGNWERRMIEGKKMLETGMK